MSKNDSNRVRLDALVKLFDLSIADIARTLNVSRPLISRILSGDIQGNGIYAKIEQHLPDIIAKRRQSFFDIDGVDVGKVIEVVEALKKVA